MHLKKNVLKGKNTETLTRSIIGDSAHVRKYEIYNDRWNIMK